jgi:hypothetical protein
MPRLPRLVAVLALVALGAACQRPSREDCEKLCWKYGELQFWAAFEDQARDLSPADRATLKTEREAEWKSMRAQTDNHGRDNCISGCRKGGSRAQIECVDQATTAAEAKACIEAE